MTERAEVSGKLDDPVFELEEEYNTSHEKDSSVSYQIIVCLLSNRKLLFNKLSERFLWIHQKDIYQVNQIYRPSSFIIEYEYE
jgi:hypothetical protein